MFFILNLNFRCVNNQVYPAIEFSRFVAAQLFALLHQSAEKKMAKDQWDIFWKNNIIKEYSINDHKQWNYYQPLSLILLIFVPTLSHVGCRETDQSGLSVPVWSPVIQWFQGADIMAACLPETWDLTLDHNGPWDLLLRRKPQIVWGLNI